MPISFNNIPAGWKMPLYWVEVDPSKAGLPINQQRAVLVGIKLTAGASATANVPIPVASQAQADAYFGRGSELARMFRAFFANSWATEVWGLPVAEAGAGTAATGTITVTAFPTAAGTYHLYIAGQHVPVGLTTAENTVTLAAAKIVAAITANADLPVTAANVAGVITVTAKWKGTTGNDIRLEHNYYGATGGEVLPTGMTVTFVQMAGGATDPTFTSAITALGEQAVDYVALPYTDSTSLTAWEAEFNFSDTGRWGWIRQHFGMIFSAKRDTHANLLTFGATRNSAALSVMGVEPTAPSPIYEWAAAYCAKAARAFNNDPARPLQSLHMEGILPATINNRFLLPELNAQAGGGIATQTVKVQGDAPMIMRETMTYKQNAYGNSDDAYELAPTMATLARLLRNQRQAITSKYPRHKLANDGTAFGAGQAIVTPKIIKAELIAQYRFDEFNGLVEDIKAFKEHLIVERDPNDANRVNVLYPPDLINQLRIFAVLAQFRLQFNRGVDVQII